MNLTQRKLLFLFIVSFILASRYDIRAQQTHRYTLASGQPAPLVADAGEDVLLTSNEPVTLGGDPVVNGGTAPYTYSWTPSENLANPESANPQVTPNPSETTYVLTVTDAKGCTDVDEVNLFINITAVPAGEIPFAIYPNPAHNWLTIRTTAIGGTLTLLNSQGKRVLKESMTPYEHQLDIRSFSKGVYLLKIDNHEAVYAIRIFIQ